MDVVSTLKVCIPHLSLHQLNERYSVPAAKCVINCQACSRTLDEWEITIASKWPGLTCTIQACGIPGDTHQSKDLLDCLHHWFRESRQGRASGLHSHSILWWDGVESCSSFEKYFLCNLIKSVRSYCFLSQDKQDWNWPTDILLYF